MKAANTPHWSTRTAEDHNWTKGKPWLATGDWLRNCWTNASTIQLVAVIGRQKSIYCLVHPRKNFRQSTRVNLSMSLYQILQVVGDSWLLVEVILFKQIQDERRQSIVANVWMV